MDFWKNILLKIKSFWLKQASIAKFSVKISLKDKINLLEQLSSLINSWIPILNSFKIMIYQTRDKKIKRLISQIISTLNKGESLKDAFLKHPNIFSTFDISIIEMWEVTWKLWDAIETIKIKEEKSKELKWKIIWALVYPMVIISLSILMIWVFMIFVIPKIQKMYTDAKVNLPDLTQWVINASIFLQENIKEICTWIIIFIILLSIFKNHPRTKIYFDRFILKIPLFGWLIKKKILALFCSSLWTLLQNGIIINSSLQISSKALENDYYEKELKKLISWVSKWIELSTLMWIEEISKWKENSYFPVELASIVKIWEQTWKLAPLLLKISQKYNKEIDNLVKNIWTAIEPIVIVVVWWIIWTLIMAIMLPFFNMVNVI